jgi:hypothetical protein
LRYIEQITYTHAHVHIHQRQMWTTLIGYV